MLIKLKTRYSSAAGNYEPGAVIDRPADEARLLIDAGYAEQVAVGEKAVKPLETAATRTGKPKGRKD